MASRRKVPRVAIVSLAGSGKSATGNMFLQEQIFVTTQSASPGFKSDSSAQDVHMFDAIEIDIPALPNTEEGQRWMKDEMEKCMASATKTDSNGLDAILLTLDTSIRYTKESEHAVESLPFIFGDNFEKYLIVVFTKANKGKDITSSTSKEPQSKNYLDILIENCNIRVFHLTDEEEDLEIKLPDLMKAVNELQEKNEPLCLYQTSIHDTKRLKSFKEKSGKSDEGSQTAATEVGMDEFGSHDTAVDETLAIAIIGPAGSGKSATGNTILGRNAFESKRSMATTTKHTASKQRANGRKIIVIDTPPLPDTRAEMSCEELAKEFHRCMEIANELPNNGLDAIILTINANGRFTEEIINGIEFARNIIGKNFVNFLIIVFTREDQFTLENFDLKKSLYSDDTPKYLRELFEDCGNRFLTINNTAELKEKERKVQEITKMIAEMKGHDHKSLNVDVMRNLQHAGQQYKNACQEMDKRKGEMKKWKCCIS